MSNFTAFHSVLMLKSSLLFSSQRLLQSENQRPLSDIRKLLHKISSSISQPKRNQVWTFLHQSTEKLLLFQLYIRFYMIFSTLTEKIKILSYLVIEKRSAFWENFAKFVFLLVTNTFAATKRISRILLKFRQTQSIYSSFRR